MQRKIKLLNKVPRSTELLLLGLKNLEQCVGFMGIKLHIKSISYTYVIQEHKHTSNNCDIWQIKKIEDFDYHQCPKDHTKTKYKSQSEQKSITHSFCVNKSFRFCLEYVVTVDCRNANIIKY